MQKKFLTYLLLSLFIAICASLPYLYGLLQSKPGEFFLARSVVNSGDTYVYLAHIASAKEGQFLLPNLYSTESKTSFLLRPSYLILGQLAKLFNLDPLTTYHLGRFIFTVGFVFSICYLIDLTCQTKREKALAFIFVFFSSGLGGLVAKYMPNSIDLWVPEANTFFSLFESPHFIWSEICLVLTIVFIFQWLRKTSSLNDLVILGRSTLRPTPESGFWMRPRLRSGLTRMKIYLLLSGFFASLTIFDYPYLAPLVFLLIPLLILFSEIDKVQKRIISLFQFFLFPTISILVIFFTSRLSPVASFWFSQNQLLTPNLIVVISGYGLLVPLALIGFFKVKQKMAAKYVLGMWVLIQFMLVYAPFPFQRRLFLGLHIPLAIMSSWGILWLYKKIESRFQRLLLIVICGLLPVTLVINVNQLIEAYTNPKTRHLYYVHNAYVEGSNWLHTHVKPNDVILAHAFTANLIPGFSGRFVYFGHKIQTYRFNEKMKEYQEIVKLPDTEKLLNYVMKNDISWILVSPFEPQTYVELLNTQSFLEKSWNKDNVRIYRVSATLRVD